MSLKIILATDSKGGIGNNNDLLYFFPKDLKRFKELTSGATVVMGRNTWDSLPKKLPNRKNLVLTSSMYMRGKQYSEGEKKPDGFFENINQIISLSKKEDVWIIGGAQLYNEMFQYADEVHHTFIHDVCENVDTYIEDINDSIIKYFHKLEAQIIYDTDKKSNKLLRVEFRTYKK
jgi:dihydrofolate reductase